MNGLFLLATVVWSLSIVILVLAVVACWRRREVGFYLLTLNLLLTAIERPAPIFGYSGLMRPGTAFPLVMSLVHVGISLLAWLLLALHKSRKNA